MKPLHHQTIHDWYAAHGRHSLPWRLTRDPYAIYVSEIMLQQTQVATVLTRFYHPFLARFPTLQSLADASQEEVLKAWEGLGYYSRARNLHQAAKICAPTLPTTVEGLLELPGIGRNTAHAIAAFAYHQPVAVMEANVKRVLHRLHAKERMTDAELWDAAMACLNPQDPFTHNQAMMDIGSLLCTPTSPRCRECPLAKECRGKHAWERFPARKEKSSTPTRFKKMLVACTTDQRYHLTPRDARLLGGLYGFPEFELLSPLEFQGITLAPELLQPLGQVRWAYSHFKLQADVLLYRAASQGENHWYNLDEISSLPLAGVDLKIMELIKQNLPKP